MAKYKLGVQRFLQGDARYCRTSKGGNNKKIAEHVSEQGFNHDMVPFASVIEQWRAGCENMRLHMIYGESVSFEESVNSLEDLNGRVREK